MKSEPDAYRFRYAVFNVTAHLDETQLVVRTGVRTAVVPVARLQHLYVVEDPERSERELLLSYATPSGRLRRTRVFADRDEPGFDALLQALLARRPEIDIRHLDLPAAYARIGTRQLEWVVLPAMMGLGLLVLALLFSPLLRHGCDRGHGTVTVAELEAGLPRDTRNVTVRGQLLVDFAVRAQVGADARLEQSTAWIPLVDAAWQPGTPVGAVLEVPGSATADLKALAARGQWDGMVRDLGWEGLSRARRKQVDAAGVPLAPEVRLVQLGARPQDDLAVSAIVLGALSILLCLVSVWLIRRRRTTTVRKARPALAGRRPDNA